jgi:ssDNA-binding Zn-finger/Zn-ribbon topoisomerase 1
MEEAINTEKRKIKAIEAIHGIYFCPECGEKVHLRISNDKMPHFYHRKHNENCSLSIKSNNGYFNINEFLNILQVNYKERWIEAIDKLIKYNFLYALDGKEWALNPLEYYIDKYFCNMNIEIYFQLLSLIVTIDNEKSDYLFIKFIINDKLCQKDKIYLIKNKIKKLRPINTETFLKIVDNIELDKDTIFNLLLNKMGSLEYNKLLKENKYPYLIYASKLIILFKKNRSEDELYYEYLSIKSKYYNNWDFDEKMFFLNTLIKNIRIIKNNTDMEKLFKEDILKLKYYV